MTDDEKAQWRAWMDRKPVRDESHWSDWFDGDTCLAAMSARTGPDVTTVEAKQRCGCQVCSSSRSTP